MVFFPASLAYCSAELADDTMAASSDRLSLPPTRNTPTITANKVAQMNKRRMIFTLNDWIGEETFARIAGSPMLVSPRSM